MQPAQCGGKRPRNVTHTPNVVKEVAGGDEGLKC